MLLTCDAAGLALFCIIGTLTPLNAGMNPVSATLLGAMRAIGGGVIRDVVANEIPQIFHPQGLYAVTALLGAGLTATLVIAEWFNAGAGLGIAALVFGLRMLSRHYRWKVPLAAACDTTP